MASEVTIKHVHELLQLMAVMTQDNRFDDIYSPDMERRTMTMCEVLDRVENRGIQKGIQKGIIQGEDTILSLMNYLLTNNRTEDAKKPQRIRLIEINCSQKYLRRNDSRIAHAVKFVSMCQ